MRSALPLALAALLVAQSGCAHYSDNHRRGVMFAGGASVLIGGIIAADGAYCDSSGVGGLGEGDCAEAKANDRKDLLSGAILLGVGLAVFGVGYFVKPKPATRPGS